MSQVPAIARLFRPSPGAGFFSNLLWILDLLDEADCRGFTSVVDMQHHRTHFNEAESVLGTHNAWEYYFEQPAGQGLDDVDLGTATQLGVRPSGRFSRLETFIGSVELLRAREMARRTIRVRQEIREQVERFVCERFSGPVLGVHVRGTDLRQGLYPSHPLPPSVQAFIDAAQRLDAQQPFATIFLACDEIETVARFARVFGARLHFTDAFRVSRHLRARRDYAWLFDHPRPGHRYLLGREVLIDALLLGRCDVLLGGWSNVVDGALLLAAELPEIHELRPSIFVPDQVGWLRSRLDRLLGRWDVG